ncbi:MAG: non-hydrolyzing UDP-N-acetylglucosamine 2-epimerase [Chloroflexota bacterium]
MLRVLSIVGTRPEAIKMAPVIKELESHPDGIISRVCVTAQHREMLDQVFRLFDVRPDYDLNLMKDAQTPTSTAAAVLSGLAPIIAVERPDWVLVQGDTTTTMAAAIAAAYAGAKVGHVEAGLRTYDKYQPFPEEYNRLLATAVSHLHFAPTPGARDNLMHENVAAKDVLVTGNTVIDALHMASRMPFESAAAAQLAHIPRHKRIVLVTSHRRENHGAPLESICAALRHIAARCHDTTHIVFLVHPSPNVREPAYRLLSGTPGVSLLPPLDYLPLIHLLKRSYLVLTDSGGLQEEAPSFGLPVLVMRNTTERPEGVEAGTCKLVGTDYGTLVNSTMELLDDASAYHEMAHAVNPYGDGHAAKRIVAALLRDVAWLPHTYKIERYGNLIELWVDNPLLAHDLTTTHKGSVLSNNLTQGAIAACD